MLRFKDVKTIVFDWDGTLHESMIIYKPAFLKAYQFLIDEGHVEKRSWTDDEIQSFLGINPKEMWASLTPHLDQKIIDQASDLISHDMAQSIKEKRAKLYPKALEVLTYLKSKHYQLVYLSNSKLYYMNAMDEAFDLCAYFDMMICSQMYQFLPKKLILERLKSSLKSPMVVIGDRQLDIETGIYNQALTIGCRYGYGHKDELNQADYIIEDLSELYQLF